MPRLRPPALAMPEMEADELLDEPGLADPVRPGDEKRHLLRRVDTLFGDVREFDELGVGRQPQLEPRRAQPEAEERGDVYWRTLT